MPLHASTRQQPARSLPRLCALLADRTAASSSARVPTTAGCPQGHAPCTNRYNAWKPHPAARAFPRCGPGYQGQHVRRMLPRQLLRRHSQQKSHGGLRQQHRRSAAPPVLLRASVACAHAALAAELANPGHDAHRLGDEFMFDEVRDCQRSLQNYKASGSDGIPAELLK